MKPMMGIRYQSRSKNLPSLENYSHTPGMPVFVVGGPCSNPVIGPTHRPVALVDGPGVSSFAPLPFATGRVAGRSSGKVLLMFSN